MIGISANTASYEKSTSTITQPKSFAWPYSNS